jgi:hypothetical protein
MVPIAAICMLSGLPILAGERVLVVPVSRRLREAEWSIHSLPFRARYDGRRSYERILKEDRPVEDLFLRQLRKDLVEAPPGFLPALLRTSPVRVLRGAVSDTGRVRVRERHGPRGKKVPKGIPTWKRVMRLLRLARVSLNSVEIERVRYGIVAVYPRTGANPELTRMEMALSGYETKRYPGASRGLAGEYLAVGPKAPHPWPPQHERERRDYIVGGLRYASEGPPSEALPLPRLTVALAFVREDVWDRVLVHQGDVVGGAPLPSVEDAAARFAALARGAVGGETEEDLRLLGRQPGSMREGESYDPAVPQNIEAAFPHTRGAAELALHILDVRAAPIPEGKSLAVGRASGRAHFLSRFTRAAGVPLGPRPFLSERGSYRARSMLHRATVAAWDAE